MRSGQGPDWTAYGASVEDYWEAVTFGNYQGAENFACDAAHSCPVREEVPLWLEREQQAHQRTLGPARRFWASLLGRTA